MFVKPVLAAVDLANPEVYAPAGALGGSNATLSNLINPLIENILIISGILAFGTILFAGFSYITAGGDKGKIAQAQLTLNYGIIGLVLVVSAGVITRLIGSILGFDFL